jgi:ring-1,2-phenylacetyl-CoA epoxidase subunit PaaD
VVSTVGAVREVLAQVRDPEIPAVSIADLGILRDVSVQGGRVVVTITPTYSGCPAMDEIRADVVAVLAEHGWDDVEVRTALAPAWTTDWISEDGKRRLREVGIAPPGPVSGPVPVQLRSRVDCPQCGSTDTEETARFASTSCKALWRCRTCREPFDHLKAH